MGEAVVRGGYAGVLESGPDISKLRCTTWVVVTVEAFCYRDAFIIMIRLGARDAFGVGVDWRSVGVITFIVLGQMFCRDILYDMLVENGSRRLLNICGALRYCVRWDTDISDLGNLLQGEIRDMTESLVKPLERNTSLEGAINVDTGEDLGILSEREGKIDQQLAVSG
ncbi:hypothetical protein Tco_0032147 [Tanacetum coccineum]